MSISLIYDCCGQNEEEIICNIAITQIEVIKYIFNYILILTLLISTCRLLKSCTLDLSTFLSSKTVSGLSFVFVGF